MLFSRKLKEKLELYEKLVKSQNKTIELQNETILSLKNELEKRKKYEERLLKESFDLHNENVTLHIRLRKARNRGKYVF